MVDVEKWFDEISSTVAGVPCSFPPQPWICSNPIPEAQLAHLGSMQNAYGSEPFPGKFEDYQKDPHFAELVEGKTVAFVGPSAHLVGKGMGDFIESHDVIVRVNQTQEIPKHRWSDFGHRTDVLASNLNAPSMAALSENIAWVKALKHIYGAGPSMWDRDKYGKIVDSWNVPWHNVSDGYLFKVYKEVGTTSSTGLSAMVVLMNYDLESLYITGNSFYNFGKCGIVYYDEFEDEESMKKVNGENTQHYRHDIHAIEPQMEFFKRLLEVHYPHKLKIDDLLRDYFIGEQSD